MEDMKSHLIEATTDVVTRGRGETLSVRSIAARAGVSPGSVLYHFGDREGLVTAAITAVLERYGSARRERIVGIADPAERIVALVHAGIPDELDQDVRFLYVTLGHPLPGESGLALHRAVVERQIDVYESTIELGVRLGAFSPSLTAREVGRTLVALEDAFNMYALVGFAGRAQEQRSHALSVASELLGVELTP